MSTYWVEQDIGMKNVGYSTDVGSLTIVVIQDAGTHRWAFAIDGVWSDNAHTADGVRRGQYDTISAAKLAAIHTLRTFWKSVELLPHLQDEADSHDWARLDALEWELKPDPRQDSLPWAREEAR